MLPLAKIRSVSEAASSFTRSCAGNVTLIVALAAIPIVAAVGIAIDYSRGTRVESELQHIVDAAALAAAAGQNLSGSAAEKAAKRTAIAQRYLDFGLARLSDAEIAGTPSITIGANTVDVAINAIVYGTLVNVLTAPGEAGKTMTISVNSKAAFANAGVCLLSLEPDDTRAIEIDFGLLDHHAGMRGPC